VLVVLVVQVLPDVSDVRSCWSCVAGRDPSGWVRPVHRSGRLPGRARGARHLVVWS